TTRMRTGRSYLTLLSGRASLCAGTESQGRGSGAFHGYDLAMLRMGIRELRDGLSRALRHVQAGEMVEITDHGRPIARIVKAGPSRAQLMAAEGRLVPAESKG